MGRVGFRHIDLSGYRLNAEIQEAIEDAGWWTFGTLGIPVNPDESTLQDFSFAVNTDAEEDESYFGPLGFLLLVPLSAGTLAAFALGRAGRAQAALAAALPLYVVGLALAYRYNPWIGRFMLTPAALTMPLAAAVYRFRGLAACSRSSGRPRSSSRTGTARRTRPARTAYRGSGTSTGPRRSPCATRR